MGIFVDDPTFDDFLAEVAAYRQPVEHQQVAFQTFDAKYDKLSFD